MRVKRLKLVNFRQYADSEFIFDNKSDYHFHLATNGTGKSTFRKAVLFALYGKDVINDLFDNIKPNNYKNLMSNGELLKRVIVELEFSVQSTGQTYILTRELDFTSGSDTPQLISNLVIVQKGNLAENKLRTESQIKSEIEIIFPRKIANFFIFDGEMLEKIENSKDIKSDIEKIMNIEKYKKGKATCKLLLNRLEKKRADDCSGALHNARNRNLELDKRADELKSKIEFLKDEIEQLEEEQVDLLKYVNASAEGIKMTNEIKDLENNINVNELTLKSMKKEIFLYTFSDDFYNFNLKNFYADVAMKLDLKETKVISNIKADAVDEILEIGRCICDTMVTSQIKEILLELKNQLPPNTINELKNKLDKEISFENTLQLEEKLQVYNSTDSQLENFRRNKKEKLEELKELKNYPEKNKLYSENKISLDKLHQELGELKARLKANVEIHTPQNIREIKKLEINDSKANQDKAKIKMVRQMYEKYDESIQYIKEQLMPEIETKTKNLLEKYEVPVSKIKIKSNYSLNTSGLSGGQKTLSNFAYLISIVEVTTNRKKKVNEKVINFPLILDAPTSSLDKKFIKDLIEMINSLGTQNIINVFLKDYEIIYASIMETTPKSELQIFFSKLTRGMDGNTETHRINSNIISIKEALAINADEIGIQKEAK
jgi:DNA sulfur modification protein DndD